MSNTCFDYILAHLTDEEKRQYSTSLISIIANTPDPNTFCINSDIVQHFLGYRKSAFAKFIKRQLCSGDYLLNEDEIQQRGNVGNYDDTTVGCPNERYQFSINALRKLTMTNLTQHGEETRRFYLKLEDLILAYKEKCVEDLQNQVKKIRGQKLIDRDLGSKVYVFKDA